MADIIVEVNGIYLTYNPLTNTCEVTSYAGGPGSYIEIPASYNGIPVTKINGAFKYQTKLTSIIIPDSITEISTSSFEGCTALKEVQFAPGCELKILGDRAFYNCSALTTISLPNKLTSIGDYAFFNCANLGSITIPANVTSIGRYAFCICNSLRNIIFTSPSKLTTIDNNAFESCTSLTTFNMPNSVTYLGDNAFNNCDTLINIALSENLTAIRTGTFYNCSRLSSIEIPEKVESIGYAAFNLCSLLSRITINNNLHTIAEEAFYDCDNLKTVYFKSKNRNTSDYAIYASDWAQIDFKDEWSNPLCYGAELWVYDYEYQGYRKLTTAHIDLSSVNSKEWNFLAFMNAKFLTKAIIENTDIALYAFNSCSNLEKIVLRNVKTIGASAFANCTRLQSIQVAPVRYTLEKVDSQAFYNCPMLTVFYGKDRYSWSLIDIASEENDSFGRGELYWYSEDLPNEELPDYIEDKWHYNETGNPTIWTLSDLSVKKLKLECFIDFDDEWVHDPESCHCKYDRIVNFNFDIYDGDLRSLKTGVLSSGESLLDTTPEFDINIANYYASVHRGDYVIERAYPNSKYLDKFTRNLTRIKYSVKLSELFKDENTIDELLASRDSEGYISVSCTFRCCGSYYDWYTNGCTDSLCLEMPPKLLPEKAVSVNAVTDNPEFSKCSWTRAGLYGGASSTYGIDSVDGYCIEMYHQRDGEVGFTPIEGLQLSANAYNGLFHTISKQSTLSQIKIGSDLSRKTIEIDTTIDPAAFGTIAIQSQFNSGEHLYCLTTWENEFRLVKLTPSPFIIKTFTENGKWKSEKIAYTLPIDFGDVTSISERARTGIMIKENGTREIFIPIVSQTDLNPSSPGYTACHCFYFKPKDLGINPGDSYKVFIYPYNTYTSHFEFGEGLEPGKPVPCSLLTNEGTFYTNKTSKGIVRVKTGKGWAEGQVFVFTGTEWKQAEAIYTMSNGSWKEAK